MHAVSAGEGTIITHHFCILASINFIAIEHLDYFIRVFWAVYRVEQRDRLRHEEGFSDATISIWIYYQFNDSYLFFL